MTYYRLKCILPCGRYGVLTNRSVVSFSDSNDKNDYNETFVYINAKGEAASLSIGEIETVFQFEYSQFLQYLHERDLRNYAMWSVEGCLPTSTDLGIAERLNEAYVDKSVCIRHAGDDMGYGLFVQDSKTIAKGAFIGEYTGVVACTVDPSAYSMNYPSTDGGYEIRALELGNVIRFVNHSVDPNAIFVPVEHEGVAHVACMSLREIKGGEQIFVNYGEAYWIGQKVIPKRIVAS